MHILLQLLVCAVAGLVLYAGCGLAAARIGYRLQVARHGDDRTVVEYCPDHDTCTNIRNLFVFAPLALLLVLAACAREGLVRLGLGRRAEAWATRPTRAQRRATAARTLQVAQHAGTACGAGNTHFGHWFGEYRDEWCVGVGLAGSCRHGVLALDGCADCVAEVGRG